MGNTIQTIDISEHRHCRIPLKKTARVDQDILRHFRPREQGVRPNRLETIFYPMLTWISGKRESILWGV